jgi:hypothetical protein
MLTHGSTPRGEHRGPLFKHLRITTKGKIMKSIDWRLI